MDRLWNRTDRTSGCWVWTGYIRKDGYANIWVKGKTILAHRFAWELTYGPIPENFHICHKCDNPSCINPSHLFLGTAMDNMRDMIKKGRGVHKNLYGEKNGFSKLSEEQVVEIRKLRENGLFLHIIANKFGVSIMQIQRITTYKNWPQISARRYNQPNPMITLLDAEAAAAELIKLYTR